MLFLPARRSLRNPLLALAAIVACGAPAALAADQAGVSAGVRGEVALVRPQAVGRQVVSGESIFLQDAIQSGSRSGMQILLLDETVFTIGPESELVVDEFVFDPKTGAGKLSAQVTKGVFRFVTGRVAKERPSDMNVRLPSGTIGVRGTMVAGRADAATKGSLLVLLGEGQDNDTGAAPGAIEVCNAGSCVGIRRAGYGTRIEGPDAAPLEPFRVPSAELDSLTQAVSDPENWVETAGSAGAGATDVAAGPPGTEDGDTRSATEVSGRATATGLETSENTLERLEGIDGLLGETVLATQDSEKEIDTPFGVLEVGGGFAEIPSFIVPGEVTTYDQLDALAAAGTTTAVYERSGIGLSDGGSYDFSLNLDLGKRNAQLQVTNLDAPSLELFERSFGGSQEFLPRGSNISAGFGANETLTTTSGLCAGGCVASVGAVPVNGNGRIADAILHAVEVVAPQVTPGEPPPFVITASPDVLIPRP